MATYSTRIYVKVDSKELIEKLCVMDVSDLGKGFYKAGDIFNTNSEVITFCDTESAINEVDLLELVARVVDIISGHGIILADTYSYDYDPLPAVSYYDGNKIVSKLLEIDGYEFSEEVDITDVFGWIQFVNDAEEIEGCFDNKE